MLGMEVPGLKSGKFYLTLPFFHDNLVVLFNQPQTFAQSNSADAIFFQQLSLF